MERDEQGSCLHVAASQKAGASVSHPPLREIRRSMIEPSVKRFLSQVTHSFTAEPWSPAQADGAGSFSDIPSGMV
jgi:hypothetical protein